MRSKIWLLSFFLFSFNSYSQHQITGVVKDSAGVIPLANVILMTSNNKFVTGVTTDNTGHFALKPDYGNYDLVIKFMGFEKIQVPLIFQSNIDMGDIMLEPTKNQLTEVLIVSRKALIERKNDRLVFNVKNSAAGESGTALDALGYTPGVIYNEDKLSILGKNEVSVLINGRISPLRGAELNNYLNSIPSNLIDRIEVITTPPSKYSANGNGGLLNIVLKKQKEDYWRVITRLTGSQRNQASGNANVTFNYKKKKVSSYVNVSGGNFKKRNIYRNTIYYGDETWLGKGYGKFGNEFLDVNLSMDYQMNDNWIIGMKYSSSISESTEKSDNLDKIVNPSQESIKFFIKSKGVSTKNSNRNVLSLFNVFNLDTLGKKITFDMDFFRVNSVKDALNEGIGLLSDNQKIENSYFENRTGIDYDFSNYSVRVDAELPFKKYNLEFGGRLSKSDTKNDFNFFDYSTGVEIFDPEQSNLFNYNEKVLAFYASGNTSISENLLLKAGLRMEKTKTISYSKSLDQQNSNDYFKIFPTFYSTYKFKNKNSLTFSLSRRLNRPSFESLDPFKLVLNPFKTVQGNPFLQPSYSWNYEIIYNNGNHELKGYLQDIKSDFEQIGEIDPQTKITNYTYLNYLNTKKYGLTETYIFNKLPWLTSYNTVDIGYSIMNSLIPETIRRQEGFNGFIQTRNQISFNNRDNFQAGINYYYVFPAKMGVSNSNGFGSLDLTFRWRIIPKTLSLYLYANDILNTNEHSIRTIYNGVQSSYKNYYDTQSFRFSIVYGFGNSKVRVSPRNDGNKDIQTRVQ